MVLDTIPTIEHMQISVDPVMEKINKLQNKKIFNQQTYIDEKNL